MSERYVSQINTNDSKNTRLPIVEEFKNYRFGRDALAHTFRYLFVVEKWIELSKELKRPIRVLDIGCGDVYLLRTFMASFQIEKKKILESYTAIDIDEKSLTRTHATLPKAVPVELLWRDITTNDLSDLKAKNFDLITNLEMIEHIKPEFVLPFLKNLREISPRLILSTPNWEGGSGQLPEDHIKEWNTDELYAAFNSSKWEFKKRIGTFGQINLMRKELQKIPMIWNAIGGLEDSCPKHLLSMIWAKFLPHMTQNYLWLLGDW